MESFQPRWQKNFNTICTITVSIHCMHQPKVALVVIGCALAGLAWRLHSMGGTQSSDQAAGGAEAAAAAAAGSIEKNGAGLLLTCAAATRRCHPPPPPPLPGGSYGHHQTKPPSCLLQLRRRDSAATTHVQAQLWHVGLARRQRRCRRRRPEAHGHSRGAGGDGGGPASIYDRGPSPHQAWEEVGSTFQAHCSVQAPPRNRPASPQACFPHDSWCRQQKHYTVFVGCLTAEAKAAWRPQLNEEHSAWRWFPLAEAQQRSDLHPVVALLLQSPQHSAQVAAAVLVQPQ